MKEVLLEKVNHNAIPPFYQADSKILILGSIPSPKSRECGFYYGHPQNRFWKVLAELFHEDVPVNVGDKMEFLKCHQIALWDVLASCWINGADDSSIKDPEANDINRILENSNVKRIYTTGKKAYNLYQKYCLPQTGIEAILLPSTSPANCRVGYKALKEAFQIILNDK